LDEGQARRRQRDRDNLGRALARASRYLLALAIFAAPLVVGAVHQPPALVILSVVAASLLAMMVAGRLRRRPWTEAGEAHLPALFAALTLVQLVPLPMVLRDRLQSAGTALLENAPGGLPGHWPMTLDPVATQRELALAGAALAVFLLAMRLASGRARFVILAKAVALSGVVALVSGLTHRLLGLHRLFGLFPVNETLLVGPMINPNHSAELYELAGFAALSLVPAATAETRILWYLVAASNLGASLATLSRGALLGVLTGLGLFALLREREGEEADGGKLRRGIAWFLFAGALVGALALSLGAGSLLAKLSGTDLGSVHEKTSLWRDSLQLTRLFPAGIGRHAFDVVYPAWKTLPLDIRFAFAENGPLQLLVDFGWLGFAMVLASLCITGFRVVRDGPRDDAQAALLAATGALLAHNLADFGLETMGVRLPFAALAGAALGRAWRLAPRRQLTRYHIVPPALAVLAMVIGFVGWLRPDRHYYEAHWRSAPSHEAQRETALRASAHFPTDYYFPLLQSFAEPLTDARTPGHSPRIAALNRALRLCPSCLGVHREVARVMFATGHRAQALATWRQIVRLGPGTLEEAMNVLRAWNFAPADIATLADVEGVDLLLLARRLVAWGAAPEAQQVLHHAETQGLAADEVALVEADLALLGPDPQQVRPVLERLAAALPGDPRPHALLARLEERSGHIDRALPEARRASSLAPRATDLARRWVDLVFMTEQWEQLDQALTGYHAALRMTGQSAAPGHLYAAQINEARGNQARALGEYRAAAASEPARADTWAALARVSESQGDISGAIAAYQRLVALRRRPQDLQELERLHRLQGESQARALIR
jgi:tetratricopeptide (TPR) repeat protein